MKKLFQIAGLSLLTAGATQAVAGDLKIYSHSVGDTVTVRVYDHSSPVGGSAVSVFNSDGMHMDTYETDGNGKVRFSFPAVGSGVKVMAKKGSMTGKTFVSPMDSGE